MASDFDRFREFVLDDPNLQTQLREGKDVAGLAAIAVRLGRERGFHFDARDVEPAHADGMKRWIERAVDA